MVKKKIEKATEKQNQELTKFEKASTLGVNKEVLLEKLAAIKKSCKGFFGKLRKPEEKNEADFANYLDFMDYKAKTTATHKLWRQIGTGVVCVALVAGVGFGGTAIYNNVAHGGKAYSINVNDHQIAMVKNKKTAEAVINNYLAKQGKLADTPVYISERLDIVPTMREDGVVLKAEKAEAVLAKKVTPITNGVSIVVNGKTAVNLAKAEDAEKALQKLKDSYVPSDSTLKVVDTKFKEQVKVVAGYVPVKTINSKDDAKLVLKGTSAKVSYHHIAKEGETLKDIAKKEGVTTKHILAYNPNLNFNKLEAGQKIKIKAEQPAVQVVTVLEKTRESSIPYKTVYKKDRTAKVGTQNIATAGSNGSEEVTLKMVRVNGEESYRERVSSTLVVAATDQVIVKGAAPTSSSRRSSRSVDSGGGGMAWPTSAHRISSYYGGRSRGYHTGVDIDGNTGDAVWAAKDGTVSSAGWSGGYGYCVLVNHGGGIVTRYAHLSSINVRSGESVSAGTTLGKVGSTGNSSGSHLHFEVIRGGSTVNPLPYIN